MATFLNIFLATLLLSQVFLVYTRSSTNDVMVSDDDYDELFEDYNGHESLEVSEDELSDEELLGVIKDLKKKIGSRRPSWKGAWYQPHSRRRTWGKK